MEMGCGGNQTGLVEQTISDVLICEEAEILLFLVSPVMAVFLSAVDNDANCAGCDCGFREGEKFCSFSIY